MIKAIEGIITKKEPTNVWIKTLSGVSYGISISLFTSASLQKGEKVELFITQVIREDANLLYGFIKESEQRIFEMLLKVNGIGASTAMAVCSSLGPDEFSIAVMNGDDAVLRRVPGIGPKTARTLIAQLSDAKFGEINSMPSYQNEAFMALESLGFKRDRISKVLNECSSNDTASLIKEALKKLA
ncbi:Holliday junction branch migration protein RuvA [Campylobacter fetus]|mgnify:CR=1 FL=1|uniref:Holliday junction branch migration complex subunit RuvA n=3 Tax=Campylobacter fetus TaxID=196 RepID=RUVA_CAMFF|nr:MULTISPECIES: Holliday junction branch migration protein RuvA [Campylobacter]A0RP49.1 RecName: Full=Holliday junction branch migration complex subunit RuvA [Campylobacter fetus subsp. fetus 82-40]OCS23395.1 Holliday junction ATP-dependent DNA helicase RuvA [Campylobacter fetus subsp. venerealis cfvi97/532]OCS26315.1 Holliday junction ATP-dependent DNA helicase RuvA [Campylobacter fetus subsp. venerealis cfvB10]OCS30761.1 Holliday junction ATP-dependent DNA helicase RuvA [Campylobacter fetus 